MAMAAAAALAEVQSLVDMEELAKETNMLIRKFSSAVVKKRTFKQYLHDYFNLELGPANNCVTYHAKGQDYCMSYGEVDRLASRIQNCLSNVTDLRGFIGVLHGQNQYFPSIQLGILRSGCGYFNMGTHPDWTHSMGRARSLLNMRFVLISGHMYDKCEEWISENLIKRFAIRLQDTDDKCIDALYLLELKNCCDKEMCYNDAYLEPFRFAYVMETSGTTNGSRKFVLVPHRSITPNIEDFITRVWKLNSNDVLWGSSPSTFDPSVCDLFCAMGVGGSILYTEETVKLDGKNLPEILFQHGVSVVQITPSFLRKFYQEFRYSRYFTTATSPLQVLALGGERCLNKDELRGLFSKSIYCQLRCIVNLYGLTEMSCWASFGLVNPYNWEPVCAGEPLLETNISTDAYYNRAETTIPGCSQVVIESSSRICTVIDEDGVVTQEDPRFLGKKIDNVLKIKTGDIGILHDPFHLGMEIVGRLDDVVKRSGVKVHLSNIEISAMNVSFIKFAQAVEHDLKIYLIVVPKTSSRSMVGLGHSVRANFFPYLKLEVYPEFYPNCVIALNTIPITENGKLNITEILKVATRQQYKLPGKYDITVETIRNVLHPVWLNATDPATYGECDIYGVSGQNFYEFGGVSATAVWMFESFFNCLGLYGAPFLNDLQPQFITNLAASTFDDIAYFLAEELSKNPMTAQVSLVSAEMVAAQVEKAGGAMYKNQNGQAQDPTQHRSLPSGEDIRIVFNQITSKDSDLLGDVVISSPLKPLEVFEYKLNMCVDAPAAVTNTGIVIVGSHSGLVIGVDTFELRGFLERESEQCSVITENSPAVLWTRCFPDRIEGEAVMNMEGSFAYLGSSNGSLFKISVIDGSIDSVFRCHGPIRAKVAVNRDDSMIVVIDGCDRLYCLNAKDLSLVWNRIISKRLRPTFAPVIEVDMVIFTTVAGGVAGYCIRSGNQIWPRHDEKENKACTPPAIWNCTQGTFVLYGIPDGFEIRDCSNGAMVRIACSRDNDVKHSWLTPVVHNCNISNISEVIFTDTTGLVMRISYVGDKLDIKRMRLDNPLISPSVVCTKVLQWQASIAGNIGPGSQCFLLTKPSDGENFVLHKLPTENEIQETLSLEPFKSSFDNFSRPIVYKEIVIFGGRDDKLHVMFCHKFKPYYWAK